MRSRPGIGSTFSVIVPRLMVPEITAPVPVATSFKTRWLEGVRILCVDDDRSILDATRAVLERWGARVDCVHDAAGFRAGGDSDPPCEIILMDYQLHDQVNGLTLLREYRSRHAAPVSRCAGDGRAGFNGGKWPHWMRVFSSSPSR